MTATATIPARPTRSDDGVLRDAAELAYRALVDAGALEEAEDDDARKQDELSALAKALGYAHGDGYRAARELDDEGWEVDADTVEILNRHFIDEAHTAALKLWIKAYGGPVLPPIGARVRVTTSSFSLPKGTVLVVVKQEPATARVIANDTGKGEGGYILDAERLEVVDGAA